MRLIDVTLTMRPDLTSWPNEPGLEVKPHSRIADGKPANVSVLTFANHSGTHVDPPVHFLEGTRTVEDLSLDALVGPCRVVGYDGATHISSEWLERASLPRDAKRLLFKTRNSKHWRDPAHAFDREFVALDESAARWCVDHGIVLVGVDYLSVEPFGSSPRGHPVHKTLLRANVVIVEGLDLRAAEPGEYELVCLPLKILRGDGAPARAILIRR